MYAYYDRVECTYCARVQVELSIIVYVFIMWNHRPGGSEKPGYDKREAPKPSAIVRTTLATFALGTFVIRDHRFRNPAMIFSLLMQDNAFIIYLRSNIGWHCPKHRRF